MQKILCLIFLFTAIICPFAQETEKIDWKKEVIYFVLLDRFANGDSANDFHIDKNNPYAYHGGDLQGLIDRLPYLQDLGITTIWLSPVFDNRETKFYDYWAYHGYWVKDFFQVEEHFGDMKILQNLVADVKKRGMHIIIDMIVNHVDYNAPLLTQKPSWFHNHPKIENWNDAFQMENYSVHGLPDLAQENPEVEEYLLTVAKFWIDKIRPHGFRLDAVKHVPINFWQNYNKNIRSYAQNDFFLLGENFEGDPKVCSQSLKEGQFSSLFDFPLHFVMKRVLAQGDTAEQLGVLFYKDVLYEDAGMLTTLLDNHDLDRFLTSTGGDQAKWKLALSLLFSVRGIPALYYGTEVGMEGAKEWMGEQEGSAQKVPQNRQDMDFEKNPELRAFVKEWIQKRRSSPALSLGQQIHLWQSRDLYAFARVQESQIALVVLNNSLTEQKYKIPLGLLSTICKEGKILDSNGIVEAALENGFLVAAFPAQSCLVFFPTSTDSPKTLLAQYEQYRKSGEKIEVTFEVTLPTEGTPYVIGGNDSLGNWSTASAPGPMKALGNQQYQLKIALPPGSVLEYKYFQKNPEGTVWELKLENRYLQVPWSGPCRVQDVWDKK